MALKEMKMAGLNLDPSRWEGDEEDEGEQSDMLAILMKIKEAKLVIDKKKKRKHLQRVQDDALTAFEADANNLLAATKKNCGKIVAKTVKRIDAHATSIADFQKKQHARADKLTKLITEFRKEGERLLAPFDTLRLENNSSDSASAEEIEKDLSTAKQEIEKKLQELERSLKTILATKPPQDELSKMLQTLLAQ